MKLTGGDSKDIITWGAGGLMAGLLYQLTSIWIKQKTNIQDLDPLTEALCDDQELFALFCQLQEYRNISEMSFRRAVDNADRLIFLHVQLQKNQVSASLTDRPNAFLHLKNAVRNLEEMFKLSQKHPMSRIPVEVHRLYVLIFTCLENHWNAILHLTQRIHHV
jgi:hypothetical protein